MADHVIETETHWKIVDEASESAEKIEKAFGKAGHAAEVAKEKVKETFSEGKHHALAMAAGILGVGFGFESLKEKVSEVTKEFDTAQSGVQGVLFAMLKWPKGADTLERVARAGALSSEVMEDLETKSFKYAASLTDVAGAYKMATVGAAALHLNEEQRQSLTEKAIAANKLFGLSGTSAMEMITRVVQTRTLRGMGEFGAYLRDHLPAGMRNLQRMSQTQLFAGLNKAMKDLPAGAAAMATTLTDSITRIKHQIDTMFRGVFGPTAKWLAEQFQKVAEVLNKTTADGRKNIEVWGEKVLHFFQDVKGVAEFVLDHWKAAAAIWASFKVANVVGSVQGMGGIGGIIGSVEKSLGGFGAQLSLATIAVAGLVVGLDAFNKFADKQSQKDAVREAGKTAGGSYDAAIKSWLAHNSDLANAHLKSAGAMDAGGNVSSKARFDLASMFKANADLAQGVVQMVGKENLYKRIEGFKPGTEKWIPDKALMNPNILADAFVDALKAARYFGPEYKGPGEPNDRERKTVGKVQNFYGGIHITQDFKDQDPDAVFVRFQSDIEDQAMHKQQAHATDWLEP